MFLRTYIKLLFEIDVNLGRSMYIPVCEIGELTRLYAPKCHSQTSNEPLATNAPTCRIIAHVRANETASGLQACSLVCWTFAVCEMTYEENIQSRHLLISQTGIFSPFSNGIAKSRTEIPCFCFFFDGLQWPRVRKLFHSMQYYSHVSTNFTSQYA